MIDEPFGPAVPSVPLVDSPLTFVVAQIRFSLVASISEERFVLRQQSEQAFPHNRSTVPPPPRTQPRREERRHTRRPSAGGRDESRGFV